MPREKPDATFSADYDTSDAKCEWAGGSGRAEGEPEESLSKQC